MEALSSLQDAKEWARSHRVVTKRGSPRITMGGHLKADLDLTPESLPFIVEFLVSSDSVLSDAELWLTASLALKHNGAHLESDAGEDRDPTYYRVTFPDGTVLIKQVAT